MANKLTRGEILSRLLSSKVVYLERWLLGQGKLEININKQTDWG